MNEELSKITLINNNILQIIEFEAHRIQLEKETVNLELLVKQTLAQLRQTNHSRFIQVNSRSPMPDLSVDPIRIQEVLLNLLDNSMKYSPPDAKIDIYLQQQEAHILVSVENTGSAIKTDDLPKIFNPFYRSASSEHPDSLGLGLTLCQINIEAHGGQIWAENLPEKAGVAFKFTLPY